MNKKPIAFIVAGLSAVALIPVNALAWGCAHSFSASGRYGGSFSHVGGSYGGYGGGGHFGASAYTSPSGHTYTASHSASYGYGGYHSSYYGCHGVSYGYPSSCSNGSAFAAGVVTGAVVGAAVASAATPAPVTYVYPSPGVYVAPAPVVYTAPPVVVTTLPVGSTTTVLPVGYASMSVNGATYYQSGPNWYQMEVGSNGVYYMVVRAP